MSRLRGAVRLGIASVAVGCALAITGCDGEEDPAAAHAVLMAGGPDYLDRSSRTRRRPPRPTGSLTRRCSPTGIEAGRWDGAHPGSARAFPDLGKRTTASSGCARASPTRTGSRSGRVTSLTRSSAHRAGLGRKRFLTDNIVGAEEFDAGSPRRSLGSRPMTRPGRSRSSCAGPTARSRTCSRCRRRAWSRPGLRCAT